MSNYLRKLEELRKELEELHLVALRNKSNVPETTTQWHYYCGRLDAYWQMTNMVRGLIEKGD